jgi:glucokinase
VTTSPVAGVYLGLDIGGTKLGMCVGTPEGRVLARDRIANDPGLGPEELLGRCRARLGELVEEVGHRGLAPLGSDCVLALGAACPGPLDYRAGRFINPPNNPRWHGFALREWLAANFACPSAMMNDANAAAYAEWLWGAARGTKTAVFLTVSTGMGAGLIIDGRLYEGPLGLAGEIGRIQLSAGDDGPVGFGRRGTVEGYCSGPGMTQMAISEGIACTQRGEASVLREAYARDGTIAPERLFEAARAGDAAARRVTDRVARELGRIMAILTDVLNPEVFVLGTIGTAYPDLLIPGAKRALAEIALEPSAAIVDVRPSSLAERGDQQALAVAHYTFAGSRGG